MQISADNRVSHYSSVSRLALLLALFTTMPWTAGARVSNANADIAPATLRCDDLSNPLGIEDVHPELSWLCHPRTADLRGLRQTAYQILVASSAETLATSHGDLWDSGKVISDRSLAVPYNGKPVTSATRCWWKVRIWDQHGNVSPWSTVAYWDTGLHARQEWGAT